MALQAKMFTEFMDGRMSGNEKLAQFYLDRFPPELRKAYDAWLTEKPFENPRADPHPFVPNLYQPRFLEDPRLATPDAGPNSPEGNPTSPGAPPSLPHTTPLPPALFS